MSGRVIKFEYIIEVGNIGLCIKHGYCVAQKLNINVIYYFSKMSQIFSISGHDFMMRGIISHTYDNHCVMHKFYPVTPAMNIFKHISSYPMIDEGKYDERAM